MAALNVPRWAAPAARRARAAIVACAAAGATAWAVACDAAADRLDLQGEAPRAPDARYPVQTAYVRYRMFGRSGGLRQLPVTVTNPYARPVALSTCDPGVEVRAVFPDTGWRQIEGGCDGEGVPLVLAPGETFRRWIAIPTTVPGRYRIALLVTPAGPVSRPALRPPEGGPPGARPPGDGPPSGGARLYSAEFDVTDIT